MLDIPIPCAQCGQGITTEFDYHTIIENDKLIGICAKCAQKLRVPESGEPAIAVVKGANTNGVGNAVKKNESEGQNLSLVQQGGGQAPPVIFKEKEHFSPGTLCIIGERRKRHDLIIEDNDFKGGNGLPQGKSSPKPVDPSKLATTSTCGQDKVGLFTENLYTDNQYSLYTPAEENILHIKQVIERIDGDYRDLAELLWKNRQNAYWSESTNWNTFEDFLAELHIKPSKAYALIGVYEIFLKEGSPYQLTPQAALEFKTTKLQRLLPSARRGILTHDMQLPNKDGELVDVRALPTVRELDRILQKIPDKVGELILHCFECGEAILTCPKCSAKIRKAVWKKEEKC